MANYNIELNRWSGSEFDQLLPKNSISGSGEPTTSTVGIVGQIYMDTSTDPATSYQCVKVDGGVYTWTKSKADNAVIRTYPVAAGQSVTAGDVVNIADGKVVNYGTIPVGGVLQLNENGAPVDYVVVHQGLPSSMYDDSCNGTWVLRKDILKIAQWDSSNVNDYANSTIQADLNSTFLARFDSATQAAIKQVKIPYRPGSGASTTINSGANGLPCKIFLLSGYEVAAEHPDLPQDGTVLDYFTSDILARRIAYLDGSVTNWWLRSPDTSGSAIIWIVNSTGEGTNFCSNYNGIRPAFVLRPSGSQAIALTTATAGQPCEVIYSGVASLPGITAGQKITSDGVYGVGIFSNVLQVWSKDRPSDFKIGDTLSTLRTDLGDKWLLCNGSGVSKIDYPVLGELLGGQDSMVGIVPNVQMPVTGLSDCDYVDSENTFAFVSGLTVYYTALPFGTDTWHTSVITTNSNMVINCLKFLNGKWIAGGYRKGTSSGAEDEQGYVFVNDTADFSGAWATNQVDSGDYVQVSGVTYGNGLYCVSTYHYNGTSKMYYAKIYTSNDASSWTRRFSDTSNNVLLNNVVYQNNTFVALGGRKPDIYSSVNVLVYSTNGTSWTYKDAGSAGSFSSAVYTQNTWFFGSTNKLFKTQNLSTSPTAIHNELTYKAEGVMLSTTDQDVLLVYGSEYVAFYKVSTDSFSVIQNLSGISLSYKGGFQYSGCFYLLQSSGGKNIYSTEYFSLPAVSISTLYTYIKAKE